MCTRTFRVIALGFGCAASVVSQTQAAPTSKQGQSAPSTQYLRLNRQILSRQEDPGSGEVRGDAAEAIQLQLRGLVREEVSRTLAHAGASAEDVQRAINDVQGRMGSVSWGASTNTPFAELGPLNGGQTMVAAYVIDQGGEAIPDSRAYLDFYSRDPGGWHLRATEGADFRGSSFYMARLASPLSGEDWFLAWGTPFGSTGTPLSLRIYAFDGARVRTVWKRGDLIRGQVEILNNTVALDYDDRYGYEPSKAPIKHIHELLRVTPNGLE